MNWDGSSHFLKIITGLRKIPKAKRGHFYLPLKNMDIFGNTNPVIRHLVWVAKPSQAKPSGCSEIHSLPIPIPLGPLEIPRSPTEKRLGLLPTRLRPLKKHFTPPPKVLGLRPKRLGQQPKHFSKRPKRLGQQPKHFSK